MRYSATPQIENDDPAARECDEKSRNGRSVAIAFVAH
jgi:hypothetical protein